ncbi:MAG TPA: APC family permease [Terracidiphilus sp.]|nr:APC family permease [Terracidiphilus sp.]
MSPSPSLKRGIKFRDLVLFYIAVVLSIRWTATGAAAGPSILLVWIAALMCLFIPLAASVMELSSRHPEEGGLYVWIREAFGDFAGFISAWTYWMSCLPLFASLLYFGAASALFAFGPRAQILAANPLYYIAFSMGWLAVIILINIRGVEMGKWLNNVCTLGAFLPLSILIVMAIVSYMRFGSATHFTRASLVPHWSFDNGVFWSGIFFAFAGVEAVSSMGDEIQNPRRSIPWALLVAGCILTIGYIGGTAALLVALPSAAVDGPGGFVNGMRQLCAQLGVGWLLAPIALLVALNAVGGTAGNLSSIARLPFVAGVDRYLPAAFGKIHPRYRTPWVAIAVYGAAGAVVALLGQAGTSVRGAYDVLVSMSVIANFLPYFLLFAAMIRMQSVPAGPEVRRVLGGKPVAIALASLGLLSTSATIVLCTIPGADETNKPLAVFKVLGGTLVLIGVGVAVFLAERRKARAHTKAPARTVPSA